METKRLATTTELAEILGISRQAVAQRVRVGSLEPTHVLVNGQYLFEVEADELGERHEH